MEKLLKLPAVTSFFVGSLKTGYRYLQNQACAFFKVKCLFQSFQSCASNTVPSITGAGTGGGRWGRQSACAGPSEVQSFHSHCSSIWRRRSEYGFPILLNCYEDVADIHLRQVFFSSFPHDWELKL